MRTAHVTHPLVDAIVERDFEALAAAVHPDVSVRALLPGGLREFEGADEFVAKVRVWFGDLIRVELLDCGADELGDRLHLWWRLRTQQIPGVWTIVEQQAYTDGAEPIERLDLLCSGFRPESV